MKNKLISGMVAVLCLLLLTPYRLRAETAPCPIDTPRAKEIWANAPQTPAALLQVLKAFMDNPKMNGFELGERLFGFAREDWGEPGGVLGAGLYSKRQINYFPFLRKGGPKGPSRKWLRRPTPYYPEEGYITLDENDDLLKIGIEGFRENFCLPPTLIKEILGEPERVTVGGKGALLLDYRVGENKKYLVEMTCRSRSDLYTYSKLISINAVEDIAKAFDDHKDSCMIALRIYRYK